MGRLGGDLAWNFGCIVDCLQRALCADFINKAIYNAGIKLVFDPRSRAVVFDGRSSGKVAGGVAVNTAINYVYDRLSALGLASDYNFDESAGELTAGFRRTGSRIKRKIKIEVEENINQVRMQ